MFCTCFSRTALEPIAQSTVTHKVCRKRHTGLGDIGKAVDRETSLRVRVGLLGRRPHHLVPLALEHLRLGRVAADILQSRTQVGLVPFASGLGLLGAEDVLGLKPSAFWTLQTARTVRRSSYSSGTDLRERIFSYIRAEG